MARSLTESDAPRAVGRPPRTATGATLSCGLYAIVVGAVTLIGWFADAPWLTSWGTELSMLPNAALASILAGGAVLALLFGVGALAGNRYARHGHWAARILGGAAGLLGALTLSQHLTGINLGIDTLLLTREWGQHATVAPGRMGPPASTAFSLIGIGVLLACGPVGGRLRSLAAALGVVIAAIAALSLVGYAFGASNLYEMPRLTAIAIQTATIIFCLGVGLVLAVPEAEPVRTLRGDSAAAAMVRRALPLALLLPLALGWARIAGQNAGLYDLAFGAALRSLVETALLLGLLWWAASVVRAHETPLRRSRESISALAQELRLVTDHMPVLVAYIGADLCYRFNNRMYAEWFGEPAEELRGRHMRDVLGEAAFEAALPEIRAALSGRHVKFEKRLPYRTGARWVHAEYIPHAAPDGSILGFYAMVADITGRKEAEQALRDSESRFREMADTAPAMLWVTDPRHRCTFLSRAWLEFTGQTIEEGLGQGWTEAIHPEDRAAAREAFLNASRTTGHFSCDYRLRRKDGHYRWVIDSGRPRFNAAGEFAGFIGSVIDVHERKEAENAVRQGAEALERSNRELERFVSIASHDLKEPLRGVALLASLVAEDDPALSEESRGRLSRITHLCERLTRMVNGLLEYARSGGERLSEPCDLERIARSALDKLEEQFRIYDARVTITGPLPMIEGDPVLLERMFANLIVNAVKHNPAKQKRVEVFVEGGEIAVRDNGPGIDPRYHDRIFDLFKRVGTAADADGVGLGLALVRNIVRSHGGGIRVESHPGSGSTFYLHFPRVLSLRLVVEGEGAAAAEMV
jgi:PAS domain S-box-containing protein